MARAALCLAACIALTAHAAEVQETGSSALNARAPLDIRVRIPEVMRLALLDHPRTLRITPEDSARGEVEVAGPRVLVVANNRRGYLLQAALAPPFFEASIDGLRVPVVIGTGGGSVAMPPMIGEQPAARAVRYRFRFARGTAPGLYAWPVALSVARP